MPLTLTPISPSSLTLASLAVGSSGVFPSTSLHPSTSLFPSVATVGPLEPDASGSVSLTPISY